MNKKTFKMAIMALLVSTIHNANADNFSTCMEANVVLQNQLGQLITARGFQPQQPQNPSPGYMDHYICNLNEENLIQQSMQLIQQFCAQKYGQQQQHSGQEQIQQIQIKNDEVLAADFHIILLCAGVQNNEFKTYIDRGDCMLPNGQFQQQQQNGAGCSNDAIYLKKNQSFVIGQKSYTCL